MAWLRRHLGVLPKLLLQSSSQGLPPGAEGGQGNGHSTLRTKALLSRFTFTQHSRPQRPLGGGELAVT